MFFLPCLLAALYISNRVGLREEGVTQGSTPLARGAFPTAPALQACPARLRSVSAFRISAKNGFLLLGFHSWHHILERFLKLQLKLGVRKMFARQHLIPHRSVVNKNCFHKCSLRQILCL